MVWEQLGKETKSGYKAINAAVLIEANLDPEDIRFTTANESKCIFIATGSTPLKHEFMLALCQEIEDLGRELYNHLPFVCGLGLATMLETLTDYQLKQYEGILRVDGDPREGQILVNYDRMYFELEGAIEKYNLEKPLLYSGFSGIDRTALTFFNRREVRFS